MMSFKASFMLIFFLLGLMQSNAAESPAELYWKSKLGNIQMPKVLKDSLELGSKDGIANINPQFRVHSDGEDRTFFYLYSRHPIVNASQSLDGEERIMVQDGRVIFFTQEKLLTLGTTMKLHFKKIDNGAKFLPLHLTRSMAVTSNNLQSILNVLSINPKSIVAQYIEKMAGVCEQTTSIIDEIRYCATSLEDMVDSVLLNLNYSKNNKLVVVSTKVDGDIGMKYTIQNAHKIGNNDNQTMVCHKMGNPYAVFLCHNVKSTDVYGVSLVDAKGKQAKAVAVCHKDTSSWDPKYLAFKLLKTIPGSKPICHFVSGDTIVWVGN